MPEVAEAHETVQSQVNIRRRVTRSLSVPASVSEPTSTSESVVTSESVYTPPDRTPYPQEAVLDVLMADIEDITQGDGIESRTAELAQALWEMQGILLRRRFGDPAVIGSVSEPDPAITTRLHALERQLASLRRRFTGTYTLQQSVSRNGAAARIDTDAMIIIIDSGARVVRSLREASTQARFTGTADAEVQ